MADLQAFSLEGQVAIVTGGNAGGPFWNTCWMRWGRGVSRVSGGPLRHRHGARGWWRICHSMTPAPAEGEA